MITLRLDRDDIELLLERQDQIDDPEDTLEGTVIEIRGVRVELGTP